LTGKGTTAAIKAWEEHHGLTVDGEMSYKEYALLKAIDSGDPHEIYELKNELRGGYPNGIDYADAYNAEPVKASNVAKVSVSQADIDEWGHEYSKVMNYAFLLKACRELKETFLTTYYTNKGLGRAETFIKDLRATIQRRLECKGYGEDNIAAVYDRGKAIALDSEEAEKLDVLMQMVQMEDEDAADSLAMQCGNLVDNDAAGYLKIKDALQFNEKVCAYEIPESAGLGYSIR
jgi:hypothetical protein